MKLSDLLKTEKRGAKNRYALFLHSGFYAKNRYALFLHSGFINSHFIINAIIIIFFSEFIKKKMRFKRLELEQHFILC